MITLKEIKEQLLQNREASEDTTAAIQAMHGTLLSQLKMEARGAGDRLEAASEAAKSKVPQKEKLLTGFKTIDDGFGLPDMAAIALLATRLSSLVALGAAVSLALVGVRGWEVKAIKNFGSISKSLTKLIPDSIVGLMSNAMSKLKGNILARFGLDPLTGKLDANGQRRMGNLFHRGVAKSPMALIGEAFGNLKNSILIKFGANANGRFPTLDLKGAKIGRIILQIKSLFRPIVSLGETIGAFFTSGAGASIMKFFGGGGAKLLAKVAFILKPLAIIMSVWEGIQTFMDTEGSTYEKLKAGIGAMLADFFGAPFDLLNSAIQWVMVNWLGIDPESPMMKKMADFSFAQLIKDMTAGIFNMIDAAVAWVKLLFSDPSVALGQMWDLLLLSLGTGLKTLTDIIFLPINWAIEWIMDKFGWEKPASKPGEEGKIIQNLFSNVLDDIVAWFTKFFDFLPSMDDIKSGLYDSLPEWIQDLIPIEEKSPLATGDRTDRAPGYGSERFDDFLGDDWKAGNGNPRGRLSKQQQTENLQIETAAYLDSLLKNGGATTVVLQDNSTKVDAPSVHKNFRSPGGASPVDIAVPLY